MMTLSMPSAVPFTDLNQSKDHICQAQTTDNRFADTTLNKIPTVNLNAAISSSLKLKHGPAYLHQVSTLDLLDKTISFHCSPAAPLDKLMKSRIERMPNSLVLINKTADNVQGTPNGTTKALFPDSELLRCCKNAQVALPLINLGLRNAGNTCYLNSVLQCLLATGSLLYFISESHNRPGVCAYANGKNGRRFCALCALYRLFQEHGTNNGGNGCVQHNNNHSLMPSTPNGFFGSRPVFGAAATTTPSFFATNVCAVCPNLRVYAQEDAHEYLLGLLSRMEDSVLAGVGKLPRSVMDTNVIRRIFGGTTRSEVTCSTCHKVSSRNDQWFNLSMDITQARSLQQCLLNYTQPEILQGANAYKCENCKQLRHARRCCRIYRPPPVLIIQFNRFSRSQKLDFRVDFPASFNVRPYMTPGSGPPVVYNLFATLNHEGYSCRSGHYVAFTKRRNHWFSHNDSHVTQTSLENVLRHAPYLLFYQLASPEDVLTPTALHNGSPPIAKSSSNNATTPTDISTSTAPPITLLPALAPSTSSLTPFGLVKQPATLAAPPTQTKPRIVFHPRVLAKSSPLLQNPAKPTVPLVLENGVAGLKSATTGDPSSAAPSPTTPTASSRSTPASIGAHLAPSISTPLHPPEMQHQPGFQERDHSKKPLQYDQVGEQEKSERERNLKEKKRRKRSFRSVAAPGSSSSTGSTNDSDEVVWVPLTRTDLMSSPAKKRKVSNHEKDDDGLHHHHHHHKRRSHKKHKKHKNRKKNKQRSDVREY